MKFLQYVLPKFIITYLVQLLCCFAFAFATMCCSGDLDGREVNIQVPPKGSDKGGGVVDLNIPNQLANEVFRYAANAKGKQTGQLDNWTNRMTDRQRDIQTDR